jgi:H/ACA ribonucleoprotein complex subunit 4
MVAVMSLKGEAVALAKALTNSDECLNMEHGVVAKTMRVLMPRGTYPKRWRSGRERNG